MNKFMSDGFLLTNETARRIYGQVKDLPVFDYHCHLSPADIYADRKFGNLTELWLEGDHYKWRVMRNAGVDERLITGDASPYEKFFAFASVLPDFAGNPVYHWAHLELGKYFGLTTPVSASTAREIWEKAQAAIDGGGFTARKLIKASSVRTVVTTDDPLDDLVWHEKFAAEGEDFDMLPCFRCDNAVNAEKEGFADYVARLAQKTGRKIESTDGLLAALSDRLDFFVGHGCVAADCSFADFGGGLMPRSHADGVLRDLLQGRKRSSEDCAEVSFYVLAGLAAMFAAKGIVMQLHTGVIRNLNTSRFCALGADCGVDSVGNAPDIVAAGRLLDAAEKNGGLPKTIVYTLNPAAYYPIATMLGNFAGGSRGKLQLGAAWWFNDHRDGIREQLGIFASTGGIGYFNGMLTDSRSFVSYARHDYFRRVLCSVLGEWAEAGEYPSEAATELARKVCYFNAAEYFCKEGAER